VESCSAVAEHHDGRFEIIHWTGTAQQMKAPTPGVEAQAA